MLLVTSVWLWTIAVAAISASPSDIFFRCLNPGLLDDIEGDGEKRGRVEEGLKCQFFFVCDSVEPELLHN